MFAELWKLNKIVTICVTNISALYSRKSAESLCKQWALWHLTIPFSLPFLWSNKEKINSLTIVVNLKTSSLEGTRRMGWGWMGWKHCKHPLSHREFSRFNGSPLRKGSFTSLVFIWPACCRAHSVGKALSSRCLLKWISSNCLALQLFNITAAGANNTSSGS